MYTNRVHMVENIKHALQKVKLWAYVHTHKHTLIKSHCKTAMQD